MTATPSSAAQARGHLLKSFAWSHDQAMANLVYRDADFVQLLGPALVEPYLDDGLTAVVAPESRGLIPGTLAALELGVGFVPARTPGALEHYGADQREDETGEGVLGTSTYWSSARNSVRLAKVLGPADRVLIIDDWVQSALQLRAVADGVEQMGATVVGASAIMTELDLSDGTMRIVGLLNGDQKSHCLVVP